MLRDTLDIGLHVMDPATKAPVRATPHEFEAWRSKDKHRIKVEQAGKYVVSTIFLAFDHGFGGRPLWFETMAFPIEEGGDMEIGDLPASNASEADGRRYETYAEALEGHDEMVAK